MQRRSVDGQLIFDYQRPKGQSVVMVRIICSKCRNATKFYVWQSRALIDHEKHICSEAKVVAL